MKEDAFAMQV